VRILIACEYSGRSRRAFEQYGHEVLSCDFEPAEDGASNHYQGDVLEILGAGWDLMLAHPPCTYLAVSGLHWNKRTPGRANKTEQALEFVQKLLNAPIPRIALENPVSCISTRIRKPEQIIQPWQFGEDASKATCLWLKNLPPLKPTRIIKGKLHCCGLPLENDDKYGCPNCHGEKKPRRIYGNQTPTGQNKLGPSDDRWKERSRTYAGIAAAWASQWGGNSVSNGIASRENMQSGKPVTLDLFGTDCVSKRLDGREKIAV